MKESFRKYYESHKVKMKHSFKVYYEAHKDKMKDYFFHYFVTHHAEFMAWFRQYHIDHMPERKTSFKEYYIKHKQAILQARVLYYDKNGKTKIASSRAMKAKKGSVSTPLSCPQKCKPLDTIICHYGVTETLLVSAYQNTRTHANHCSPYTWTHY